jgi:spore germination cell wall hydrolase CwlJ-like protein
MERKHYIIGVIIFLLFAVSAAADETLTYTERIVALTILGEARGEGKAGMYAVACILEKRRIESDKHMTEVCLKPKQFSIWNGIAKSQYDAQEQKLDYLWKEKPEVVNYARWLARKCVSRTERLDQKFTGNANHYYSTDRKTPPYWTFKIEEKNGKKIKTPIKPTRKIGKHIFYKLK